MKQQTTNTFFIFIIGAVLLTVVLSSPVSITFNSLLIFFNQSLYELISQPDTLLGIIVLLLIVFFAFVLSSSSQKKYFSFIMLSDTRTINESNWNPFSIFADNFNAIILFCIILFLLIMLFKMFDNKK